MSSHRDHIERGAILIYDHTSVARMRQIMVAVKSYADLVTRIGAPDIAERLTVYAEKAIDAADEWIEKHPTLRGPQ